MIIKLTKTKTNIWVNVNHITYININFATNITNIFVLECDNPIEVIETPEEIMELINQCK
jgi:hypothetical protein